MRLHLLWLAWLPLLAAAADDSTLMVREAGEVRYGRRIEYSADGRAREIRYLRADGSDSGAGELLDAPVPAAPDPGGVAVAHVDSGVNYLLPEIARRLARDEDGAALGYDWWDMDARPFDQDPSRSPFFPRRHGTRTASLLLEEAPYARLIPYRYPRPDMSRMRSLVEAAAKAGARIVTVAMGSNDRGEWRAYEEAARRHPKMLFIVSAGNDGRDIDREPVYPAALELENQLTVTSAEDDGRLARGSNWGSRAVDLLVPAERVLVTDFDGRRVFASGSSYAVARVGALAACLLGAHPGWSTKALREAILAYDFVPDPLSRERGVCPAVPGSIVERASEKMDTGSDSLARKIDLTIVALEGSGWQPGAVRMMVRGAAKIFAQCGVALPEVSVHWLSTPERLRYFATDTAQALVGARAYAKPTVYLMTDTRRPVPFDAEAFAPANSGTHPELAGTVWIMKGMRHPEVALAHELVHVLTNSGEHSDAPGNLMREETALENTRLTEAQCSRIRSGVK